MSAKPFRHSDRGESLSSCEKFGAGRWWGPGQVVENTRFITLFGRVRVDSKTPSDQQIEPVASLFRHNEFSLILM